MLWEVEGMKGAGGAALGRAQNSHFIHPTAQRDCVLGSFCCFSCFVFFFKEVFAIKLIVSENRMGGKAYFAALH